MSKEETIKNLKKLKSFHNGSYGTAIAEAIKALEQISWIPVSESLPEEYNHVLCQFCMGGMAECYYAHNFFHVVGGLRVNSDEVIAWQPLPQPYKAESEG